MREIETGIPKPRWRHHDHISNGNADIIADVDRRTREREAWQAGEAA